jgi:hypothetical protein
MVGVYINDILIYEFIEKINLLKNNNIQVDDLKFYCSDIKNSDTIILKGNLHSLIDDIKENRIIKVILFSDDKIKDNDMKQIINVANKYNIHIITL